MLSEEAGWAACTVTWSPVPQILGRWKVRLDKSPQVIALETGQIWRILQDTPNKENLPPGTMQDLKAGRCGHLTSSSLESSHQRSPLFFEQPHFRISSSSKPVNRRWQWDVPPPWDDAWKGKSTCCNLNMAHHFFCRHHIQVNLMPNPQLTSFS